MSASEEANDHANILSEARRLRLGTWIEKILRQARKSLTGMGVADTKDLTEKQINALPNLTGQASYPGWIKPIVKFKAPHGPLPSNVGAGEVRRERWGWKGGGGKHKVE